MALEVREYHIGAAGPRLCGPPRRELATLGDAEEQRVPPAPAARGRRLDRNHRATPAALNKLTALEPANPPTRPGSNMTTPMRADDTEELSNLF